MVTNNMVTTLLSIIVPLSLLLLKMFIDIKIKFAQTEQEAKIHAITLTVNIFLLLALSWLLYSLFVEFSSPEPLTKKLLLYIIISSSLIVLIIVQFIMQSYLTLANQYRTAIFDNFSKIITLYEKLPCKKETPNQAINADNKR